MPQEICIAIIHGMGSQDTGFSTDMQEEINDRIGSQKAKKVHWGEIYWADILKNRQEVYLQKAIAENELDFITLRRFMVNSFGDASAYRKTDDTHNTAYKEIHQRVDAVITALDDPSVPPRPLIIIAHSLGGHIISNYIYDMQKPAQQDNAALSDFQKLKTLAGIVTCGCCIPFFTLAYKAEDIYPISFPGDGLSDDLKNKAKWLNFYDPDDILGYPLKCINDAYSDVVTTDTPINVGGIFSSWNPLSHMKYWTDDDFTEPLTRFIESMIES